MTDDELYSLLDLAHGAVLRAKYRLRENPDAEALATELDNLRYCVNAITALRGDS